MGAEWDYIKDLVKHMITNHSQYLEIWKSVLNYSTITTDCPNILIAHNRILLVTPFTNSAVERTFSRLNRV